MPHSGSFEPSVRVKQITSVHHGGGVEMKRLLVPLTLSKLIFLVPGRIVSAKVQMYVLCSVRTNSLQNTFL
jgi:hypothetical protein